MQTNERNVMQISNAIKKLTKEGFVVNQNGIFFSAVGNRRVISFIQQNDRISCINVRSHNDKDDVASDYTAGVFCDNLSQAIRLSK